MNKNLKSLAMAGIAALVTGAAYASISIPSTNVPLPIPDSVLAGVNSTLDFTVSGTISDADVAVDITHTWNDDLIVSLASPVVAAQVLMTQCGGSGDNVNVLFDQDSTQVLNCAGTGIGYSGTLAPSGPGTLNAFDASASGGTWTLNVVDDSAICSGTLNAWSLTLDGPPPLPVELMNFEVK